LRINQAQRRQKVKKTTMLEKVTSPTTSKEKGLLDSRSTNVRNNNNKRNNDHNKDMELEINNYKGE